MTSFLLMALAFFLSSLLGIEDFALRILLHPKSGNVDFACDESYPSDFICLLERCIARGVDREICLANAVLQYVYPSHTPEDCLGRGYGCWTPQTSQSGLLQITESEAGCHAMGGHLEPLFSWTPAEWIGGRLLPTKWIPRELLRDNLMALSLNFTSLASSVSLPAAYNTLFTLQNQVGTHSDDIPKSLIFSPIIFSLRRSVSHHQATTRPFAPSHALALI